MARRSTVRHGPQPDAYAPDDGAEAGGVGRARGGYVPPVDPWDVPARTGRSRRESGRGWSGSGGRWWVWVGRAILWAFILIVLVNGVRAPFERFMADQRTAGTSNRVAGPQFPEATASAYALQFGTIYLNYDQATASDRATQLEYFLPDGADPQLGWNGLGTMALQSIQVAGIDVRDANQAIVTMLAKVNGTWLQLAVPVYTKDGRMVISGQPALLPPPSRATLPERAAQARDTGLEGELQQTLSGFFDAYGSGNIVDLQRYSDGGAIEGLAGSVSFGRLAQVVAPQGDADQREVTAAVVWQVPSDRPKGQAGELEQTYRLSMVKKDGKWFVRSIQGST